MFPKIWEMNAPSQAVFITMPLFRNFFTSDIVRREFWPLVIPILLAKACFKYSNLNPATVCKIFVFDVFFFNLCSLVKIQQPLKFWIFSCTHCFNSGRNCSDKFIMAKHVLSFSWIFRSSVSMGRKLFSGLGSLKKPSYWKKSWRKVLRHTVACNLLCMRIQMIYALGWIFHSNIISKSLF